MPNTLKILPSPRRRCWRLVLVREGEPDLEIALISDELAREVYGATVGSWDMPATPPPPAPTTIEKGGVPRWPGC